MSSRVSVPLPAPPWCSGSEESLLGHTFSGHAWGALPPSVQGALVWTVQTLRAQRAGPHFGPAAPGPAPAGRKGKQACELFIPLQVATQPVASRWGWVCAIPRGGPSQLIAQGRGCWQRGLRPPERAVPPVVSSVWHGVAACSCRGARKQERGCQAHVPGCQPLNCCPKGPSAPKSHVYWVLMLCLAAAHRQAEPGRASLVMVWPGYGSPKKRGGNPRREELRGQTCQTSSGSWRAQPHAGSSGRGKPGRGHAKAQWPRTSQN